MSDRVTLELFYIRHGESLGNIGGIEGVDYPFNDPPLTEFGALQAKLCGERMSHGRLDALYSSPLERAVHTAHEIAIGQGGLEYLILPDLIETDTRPSARGCSPEVLAEKYPFAIPALVEPTVTGGNLVLPDVESYDCRAQRAKRVIDYMCKRYTHGEKVALVSHGGLCGYIMRCALNAGYVDSFRWSLNNTGITKIKFYENELPKLSYSNDTSHLFGLKSDMAYTI